MQTITIDGKKIDLLFDLGAMELGIDAFGSMTELQGAMRHEEGRNALRDIVKLVTVMANNANDAKGKKTVITEAWVRHHIAASATGINDVIRAVSAEIAECYKREKAHAESEAVDGYLEEDNASKNS